MPRQKAKKTGDIVTEIHEYTGPNGTGEVTYEYKMIGQDIYRKKTKTGAEVITTYDFTKIEDDMIEVKAAAGTEDVIYQVLKVVPDDANPGYDKNIVVQESYTIPKFTYSMVPRTHPYKAQFFGA